MVDQNRPRTQIPTEDVSNPRTVGPCGGGVESIAWTTQTNQTGFVLSFSTSLTINKTLPWLLATCWGTVHPNTNMYKRPRLPSPCPRAEPLSGIGSKKSPDQCDHCHPAGWWYTYPSEKYDFVSWDDCSQCMENHKSHVPVTTNITKQWKIRWQALYEKVGIPASCCFKLTAPGVGHPFFPRYLDPKRTISAHQPGSVTGCHRATPG